MLLPWEAFLLERRGMSMPLEASLVRSPRRPGLRLMIGLHVTIAIVDLLSVFIFFCSSASKVSCDEQI